MNQMTELQRARAAYAEALKSLLVDSGLPRDEMMGRLSAEISDLWNRLELDLQRLPRRPVPACQVKTVAGDAPINLVAAAVPVDEADEADELPAEPPIDCVADAEQELIAALGAELSNAVKPRKK